MKALLAKIPRDRSLLLLLAPVLVLLAFLAAGRSEDHYSALPVGATAPTSTTSTALDPFSAEGAAAGEQAAEVEGTSVSRSGTTSGSGGGSGSSGSSRSSSPSGGSGSNSAAAQGTTTTSELPEWINPDGSTTSTTPGSTTTTTVPDEQGPDPAVNEVPVAILLPISAVIVVAIAAFVVARRRRHGDSPPSSPTRPTTSA